MAAATAAVRGGGSKRWTGRSAPVSCPYQDLRMLWRRTAGREARGGSASPKLGGVVQPQVALVHIGLHLARGLQTREPQLLQVRSQAAGHPGVSKERVTGRCWLQVNGAVRSKGVSMTSKACEAFCALHCWQCASMHVVMKCAFARLLSPLAAHNGLKCRVVTVVQQLR